MQIARHMRRLTALSALLVLIAGSVHALEQDGRQPSVPDAPAASLAPQPESQPESPPELQSGAQPPPAPEAAANPAPSTPAPSTPAPASPAASRPGLIDALGNLFKDSADSVAAGLRGTGQRIQDLNKGTVETLTSLPMAGIATGRSLCPRSANGAPDCYAAADRLCADKGFSAGRSLDTQSAETCNPRIYLPGHQRKAGDCRTDTFVTRAACQ